MVLSCWENLPDARRQGLFGGTVEQEARHAAIRDILKAARFFSSLSMSQVDAVATASIMLTKDRDAPILIKDSDVLGLYVCVRGEVGVFLERSKTPVAVLRPPDTFGEVSLLDSRKASATVRAVSDGTELLLVKRDLLLALLSADPSMAACLYRELALDLAGKLRKTDDQLAAFLQSR